MTSENYRSLLNNEFVNKEMTKDDFNSTLMHFAMLYHKEQEKESNLKLLLSEVFEEINLADHSMILYRKVEQELCEYSCCDYPVYKDSKVQLNTETCQNCWVTRPKI